jgi:vesicle coat complex subunit
LTIMLNGDPMPSLLMHIIRFVMPSKYKPLKKLLYFYYEICQKLQEKLPESVERAVPNAIHDTGNTSGVHRTN